MNNPSRRTFVAASSATVAATVLRPQGAAAALAYVDGGLPAGFPSQDPETVRLVVLKAHVDYDAVRELVTPRPALAKAAWDWGFGDWESALGAASHMGRRDMAELLIEHGARPNLFTFAMLDQTDAIRAICEANPGIQRLHGPHGITLMGHARNGKAAGVMEYLEQLGDADIGQTSLPMDEQAAEPFVGEYVPEGAPDVVFRITFHERRSVLRFQRDERQGRALLRVAERVFNPGGAAHVRVTFEGSGRASALTVNDGGLVITARRRIGG